MAISGRSFPLRPHIGRALITFITETDTATGSRSGAPVDTLSIGVVLTDTGYGSRSGAPPDSVGSVVFDTAATGSRSGAPADSLTIGVALADTATGSSSGSPPDSLSIGVVLTDGTIGSRSGAPVDLIVYTVTDTATGSRSGAPAGSLTIGVTLTDTGYGSRSGAPRDTLLAGLFLQDTGYGCRSGAPIDTIVFGAPPSLANPNYPVVGFDVDFRSGPPYSPGGSKVSVNAPYRRLAVKECSIQRGRQYELDQVQAGTCTLTILDPLELLNPDNTASPFNAGSNSITAYRAIQVWAMWPTQPGSGNLINTNVSTGFDPSFENGTLGQWSANGGTTTLANSTAQHWDGTHSLLVTQSASGAGFGALNEFYTVPALTYTFSAYVRPTGGCSVTIQVTDALGNVTTSATASTQNTWTRLSVTWTTQDTAEPVVIYGTGVSTPTFNVDATMLEFGSQVNTYTTSGPTLYSLFAGYVERWPTTYDMDGLRAVRPLTAVDALAVLSRTQITQSYRSTVLADSPNLYIPYTDASAPTKVILPQGGAPATGYTHAGNSSGSVNYGGDSFLDGTSCVTVVQQNANPPIGADNTYITYAGTIAGSLSMNPQAFTIECWIKPTSGTVYLGAAAIQPTENPNTESTGPQYYAGWYTSGGQLCLFYTDPNGGSGTIYGISNAAGYTGYPDGQWHHLVLIFLGGSTITHICDGNVGGTASLASTPSAAVSLTNFFVESTTIFGDAVTDVAVANMATYPVALTNTQAVAHYNRGVGYINEVSGSRVIRLLNQYWGGGYNVALGYRQMAPDFDYNTRFLLDVLQEIQETERGLVYVDRTGVVTFEDSTSRYVNSPTAKWVFAENPAGASPTEYPYSDYGTDNDPTYTFSQANLTRPGNSNYPPQPQPLPVNPKYGQRILTQQVQVNTDFDLQQAATFYLNRYAKPRTRISKLSFNPAGNPAMWPVMLGLEISQRNTVKRRNAGVTTVNDYYVEQVSHKFSPSSWTTDIQASPVFNSSAWILGDSTYGVLGSTTIPVY